MGHFKNDEEIEKYIELHCCDCDHSGDDCAVMKLHRVYGRLQDEMFIEEILSTLIPPFSEGVGIGNSECAMHVTCGCL